MKNEIFGMQVEENQRDIDGQYYSKLSKLWDESNGSNIDKLKSFTKYVPFTEFPKLFAKYEIFQKVLNVHGAIVEAGVHQGSGLFTWGILSTIFEPVNHIRKIIGFDTFEGFVNVDKKDQLTGNSVAANGSLSADSFENLRSSIETFNTCRPLNHIEKIELIKGDACQTIPQYLVDNPHLIVALLYLDFDIYQPTKIALEALRPRMPKGAIIAFDELYVKQWPGETLAVLEILGIQKIKIERFPFHPQISFVVLD